MIKDLGKFVFAIFTFYMILSILNFSSYISGVHDCSNMAVEQYNFLKLIGVDNIRIVIGEYNGYNHSWLSVYGYEYDVVSLLPMWIYNIPEQPTTVREYVLHDKIYPSEWKPHYISYINCIPTLFILFLFNILRITVIRKMINNAHA